MEGLSEISPYLNTEIVCTLSGLGYAEGNDYYKSADCLECLKDLIKFLRRDDTTCDIRRQLGHSKVLQNDLIAIVKSCTPKETAIFDMVIRLLVNLTQPAMLCFENNKIPDDKTGRHYYMDLINQLQAYKEAFTDKAVMAVIGRELARALQKDWDDRQEEDYLLIERILLLIRNVLHVPANPQAEKRTDDDASIHDQVIWSIHQNGIDDLLLYIASSPDERRWCMHTLEIISLMLREQNAESLARAGEGRSKSEKSEDERQLEIIRERELVEKKNNARKLSGSRHSRFGGTFNVKNMMSIADKRELIYHRSVADAKNMTFDRDKTAPRKRKNQIVVKEMTTERKSTLSIRLFLQEFCKQFLEHCYNPLLHVVRDNLMHERSQENDESYFLWAMKFYMEFTRHYDFRVDFVGETMSVGNFQYVLKIMMQYYDSYTEDKQNPITWGRRLHLAVQAYKELLMYVMYMESSSNENLKANAKVIKANIFYMVEYRDIFLFLLRKYDKSKQSKACLRDLVETFHVFLKMLEQYCAGKSHIVIQQKKKPKRNKSSRKKTPARVSLTPEQTGEMWKAMASELSSWLQGHAGNIPDTAVPFDAASEVPVDQQRVSALCTIQTHLQSGEYADSIALLRASRDIWPNDSFGAAGIDPEDEFMCLHDIFKMTDLPIVDSNPPADMEGEANEEEVPAEEEELEAVVTRETEFDLHTFISKLACPSILQPYCWLLSFYRENSAKTNHYAIKMLHRIAVDLKMTPMLFQLSLFATFNEILHDPAAKQYKEMVKFSRYILDKFFEVLPKNPVLCVELVAWKSANACYEISEGYGSLQNRSKSVKKSGGTWTYEEEEELKTSYHRYQEGQGDVIDNILDSLADDTRTRRQVINKLVSLGLVTDRKSLRKKASKKGNWSEAELEQLRTVYEEYRHTDQDVVEKILSHLTNTSRTRRQVVNQIVKMGLVEDKKTLRKKRKQGEGKRRRKMADQYEDSDGESRKEEGGPLSSDEDAEDSSSSSESDSNSESLGNTPLSTLITNLKDRGLEEQIKWIQANLRRLADDRDDDDDWQAFPLVTITEENEDALSTCEFRAMLKHIGMAPPANEQQTFWRIPRDLQPSQLRKAAEDLEGKGQEMALNKDTNSGPSMMSPTHTKSSHRKDVLVALAASRKEANTSSKKRKERKERKISDLARASRSTKKKAQEWRMALPNRHSDEEKSDREGNAEEANDLDADEHTVHMASKVNPVAKKPKRRVRAFNDSDEENDVIETMTSQGEHLAEVPPGKRLFLEDSDDETDISTGVQRDNLNDEDETRKKRPRVDVQAEQSEEEDVPLVHHKKVRRVLQDEED